MWRIEITCKVSMMSPHLAISLEGHLQQLYHTFTYLSQHHNSRLVFDPVYPVIYEYGFGVHEWRNVYGNVPDEIPPKAPEVLGKFF